MSKTLWISSVLVSSSSLKSQSQNRRYVIRTMCRFFSFCWMCSHPCVLLCLRKDTAFTNSTRRWHLVTTGFTNFLSIYRSPCFFFFVYAIRTTSYALWKIGGTFTVGSSVSIVFINHNINVSFGLQFPLLTVDDYDLFTKSRCRKHFCTEQRIRATGSGSEHLSKL